VKNLSIIIIFILFLPVISIAMDKPRIDSHVSGDIYSQIQVIDLDNDGKKEMIFGASDGMVHVYDHKGKEKQIGAFPFQTAGPIMSKLSITYNKENKMKVYTGSMDGSLYCIDAEKGLDWKFRTGGSITFTPPEIIKNEKDEQSIFIASRSGKIFKINEQGEATWSTTLDSPIVTPLQIGNEGEPGKEKDYVIARGVNGVINHYDPNKTSAEPIWKKEVSKGDGYWPVPMNYLDMDLDGKKEVLTETGYPENKPFKIVEIKKGGQRKDLRNTIGKTTCYFTYFDIDNDGYKEVISMENENRNLRNYANLVVFDKNGKVMENYPKNMGERTYSSAPPKLADITGDGKTNIIFTYWKSIEKKGLKGYVDAFDLEGKRVKGYPKEVGISEAPMTIADLDGDGLVELIIPGGISETGAQLNIIRTKGKIPVKIEVLNKKFTFKRKVSR